MMKKFENLFPNLGIHASVSAMTNEDYTHVIVTSVETGITELEYKISQDKHLIVSRIYDQTDAGANMVIFANLLQRHGTLWGYDDEASGQFWGRRVRPKNFYDCVKKETINGREKFTYTKD